MVTSRISPPFPIPRLFIAAQMLMLSVISMSFPTSILHFRFNHIPNVSVESISELHWSARHATSEVFTWSRYLNILVHPFGSLASLKNQHILRRLSAFNNTSSSSSSILAFSTSIRGPCDEPPSNTKSRVFNFHQGALAMSHL